MAFPLTNRAGTLYGWLTFDIAKVSTCIYAMRNVILFGNGLNRLNKKNVSWSDLLNSVMKNDGEGKGGHVLPKIPAELPNTLQYEYILFNSTVKDVADRQFSLKRSIAQKVDEIHSDPIYDELANLPFDAYLTTNYDHAFDVALQKNGFSKTAGNHQETLYNIRRYRELTNGKDIKRIYPIHGDMSYPKSIVIDYNHYCGTLGKISDYLKGHYEWKDKPLPKMEERVMEEKPEIFSWIDHFFFSNVHILGLGLDFSEIDLWWLLDRRKRLMLESDSVQNHIYYHDVVKQDVRGIDDELLKEPYLAIKAKYELLEKMDVKCQLHEVKEKDFRQAYLKAIEQMD